MTFECWFAGCERIFTTRDQLKNHVSNHGYLRVVCPWCSEDEKSKRRMVDLKRHVSVTSRTMRDFTSYVSVVGSSWPYIQMITSVTLGHRRRVLTFPSELFPPRLIVGS
ncbi:hypothetical protein DPMN_085034 [Dreissena polymorpha]|uniref:C2H2-type domain-containing protein n=1 Tax=Dreissena polymorpha TaxID=45954 RepID=A0A9D3YFN6_DREPO|nr:hypothetical protein DPMN_085034 [Dreissena polymorpha]